MNLGVQGRYRMVAHKLDGSSRVVADWFPNLILNNGLDAIGNNSSMFSQCFVGAGTSAPSVSQTSLDQPIGSAGNYQTGDAGSNVAGGFCWERRTFRFFAGQATGNLSEVGVGSAASDLFSRALILNGAGQPTTVTVLPDEILDVTYEVRLFWPTTDTSGSVAIAGVGSVPFTIRAAGIGAWRPSFLMGQLAGGSGLFAQGWKDVSDLGPIGDLTFGNGQSVASTFEWAWQDSYNPGSYSRTGRATFGISTGSEAFNAVLIYNSVQSFNFKILFGANIPKTGSNQFRLDTLLTWARRT